MAQAAQLRKKSLFLCFCRLRTELKCHFHWTRVLTAYNSRSAARLHLRAGCKLPPHDSIILTFLTLFVKQKEAVFPPSPKGKGFHTEDFDESENF